MKKVVLVTGGTGLIGKHVVGILQRHDHEVRVLSRNPSKREFGAKYYHWNPKKDSLDQDALYGVDVVVHLAGEGIADKPWTRRRKKSIIKSRTKGLDLLYREFRKLGIQPERLVSASAVGYYTHNMVKENIETSPKGNGFLADSVDVWEEAIDAWENLCPQAKLRIGFVLSGEGGGLPEMMKPFENGLGASIGSGKQMMSWVHIDDVANGFVHAVEEGWEGVFNMVSPNPVSNKEFSKQLAKTLGKRLLPIPLPGFVLRMAMGERADLVLADTKVIPKRLQEKEFDFRYPNLPEALNVSVGHA